MSVENPLVSVIVPVYNTDEYLCECLDSLVNQTLKDIEIICIDDSSSDNSLEILKDYSRKDDRIILLENNSNQGQSISRNKGLDIARGEYVTFLDSDDRIEENAYERLYKFAKDYNHDLVVFNAKRFNDEEVIWNCILHSKAGYDKTYSKTNIFEHKTLIYDTSISKFIKKDFLDKYNFRFMENILYEDLLFSMEVLCASECLGILHDVTYFWRVRTTEKHSVTQLVFKLKNLKDRIVITKNILTLFNSSSENLTLMDVFYNKLVEIDILQYINEFDRCDEEYVEIMLNTVKPFAEKIPESAFDNLNEIDNVKYDLFFKNEVESLKRLVHSERAYKDKIKELNSKNRDLRKKFSQQSVEKNMQIDNLKNDNLNLKREIKDIKTTKVWFGYKIRNIYQRMFNRI